MPIYPKEKIEKLIDGALSWVELKDMMSASKDIDRFDKYVEIIQSRVKWKDKIILPYALHLYIVAKEGMRIIKCDCGYEFGDYRENWKLKALIHVRDTEEKLNEIYPKYMYAKPEYQELREYFCPGCLTLLDVEAVTPGYPPIFEFLPDIDAFYKEWLGRDPPDVEEKK
ncbi:MAG: acetone carboxylase subunit gamma [Candidatus Lokiarchaeia archaeon]